MDTSLLHHELEFRTSRSSGSGGQHVNKVETRVEALFDIDESVFLSDREKALIKERLANRLTKEGVLVISSQTHRSQHRNKQEVTARFDEMIQRAVRPRKKRRGHIRRVAHPKKRLEAKKRQAEKKARRKKIRTKDYL